MKLWSWRQACVKARGIALLPMVLALLVFAMPLPPAQALDQLKSFNELQNATKGGKVNSFTAPNPQATPAPDLPIAPQLRDLKFQARLAAGGDPLRTGLIWRVYSPIPGPDGKLPLKATSEGGMAEFHLPPGDYFVNCAFGRATVTKKVNIAADRNPDPQDMVLDAGGIVLKAVSGNDVPLSKDDVSFSVYGSEVQQDGERGLVVEDVEPGTLIRLNAGTYHVVSEYGDVNAVAKADIKVEAGKITEATLRHKAARITFKLVSQAGGEAIADTKWSILTSAGDSVGESVSAYPEMVLSEGSYVAAARNKNKIYQRSFTVTAGANKDVEVMLSDTQPLQSAPDAQSVD